MNYLWWIQRPNESLDDLCWVFGAVHHPVGPVEAITWLRWAGTPGNADLRRQCVISGPQQRHIKPVCDTHTPNPAVKHTWSHTDRTRAEQRTPTFQIFPDLLLHFLTSVSPLTDHLQSEHQWLFHILHVLYVFLFIRLFI